MADSIEKHVQRLRITIEHAMTDTAQLSAEVRSIAHRLPLSERGHVGHLRAVADRLDLLENSLAVALRDPGPLDEDEISYLARWGTRLAAAVITASALVGHGAITRTGEMMAEYLSRSLTEVISVTEEPTTPRERLSDAIRRGRLDLGISTQQLAQHLGVTRQYVSALENARSLPSSQNLQAIADLLQIDGAAKEELLALEKEARQSRPHS